MDRVLTSEEEIKKSILEITANRGAGKSICPSEVARKLFGEDWRNQMQNVRDAAFDLAEKNLVFISQKSKEVDAKQIKGPIRISIKSTEK